MNEGLAVAEPRPAPAVAATAAAALRVSFEFFPPRSETASMQLWATVAALEPLRPCFVSVTYGAGGTTHATTVETITRLRRETALEPAAHLTCVGAGRAEIDELLRAYWDAGIRHIVALRGDLPSGAASAGELRHANELVQFIRERTGDHFHIDVACYPEFHPQAKSPQDDLRNFKRKIDAGANSAITQYFYNADSYFRFIDDCEAIGIAIPIVPGVMPISNFSQLARFSDACGTEIPRWLRLKMASFGDDLASIRSLGLDIVTDLCDRLLSAGAPGLHFYTMNQAGPTSKIWQRLGL